MQTNLRRWINLCEAQYGGQQLLDEITSNGDLDAFDAFVAALPDWTETGTEEAFEGLTTLLRPVMQYTSRVVRPNLTKLYFGTDNVPHPSIGMVLPRPTRAFHHWSANTEVARHFATLASRGDPRYGHGCVAEVAAVGVVLDVFWLTGALIEMPELPFNRQNGTSAWESGWLEDEIITFQNTEPATVIWIAE